MRLETQHVWSFQDIFQCKFPASEPLALQAERRMIRERYSSGSAASLSPHQAAVLKKKMGIVKRFSAIEAMLIHAAAAAAADMTPGRSSQVSLELRPLSTLHYLSVNSGYKKIHIFPSSVLISVQSHTVAFSNILVVGIWQSDLSFYT